MEVVCVVVAVVLVVDMEKSSGSTVSVLCEGLIVNSLDSGVGCSRTTENFLRNNSGKDLRKFSFISNEPPRMSETSTHDQRCGLNGHVNEKNNNGEVYFLQRNMTR